MCSLDVFQQNNMRVDHFKDIEKSTSFSLYTSYNTHKRQSS